MEVAKSLFERVAPTPRNPYKTSAKTASRGIWTHPGDQIPLPGRQNVTRFPSYNIYIYIYLSLSLYLSLSVCPLSLSLSPKSSIWAIIWPSLSLSLPLFTLSALSLSLSPSLTLSALSLSLSLSLSALCFALLALHSLLSSRPCWGSQGKRVCSALPRVLLGEVLGFVPLSMISPFKGSTVYVLAALRANFEDVASLSIDALQLTLEIDSLLLLNLEFLE